MYYRHVFPKLSYTDDVRHCRLCFLYAHCLMIKECYDTNRFSNCYVEHYFNNLKTILNEENNLKPSKFIRKCRMNVLTAYREVNLKIPKSCETRQSKIIDPTDERISKETWKRHSKKELIHFYERLLRKTEGVLSVPTKN